MKIFLAIFIPLFFLCIVVAVTSYFIFRRNSQKPRQKPPEITQPKQDGQVEHEPDSGEEGENIVNTALLNCKREYEILMRDVILGGEYPGDSCEIDHIFFSYNGIYVIETKNISGVIIGDDEKKYWTQLLADGTVKNSIYSPVKQNAAHMNVVRRILGRQFPIKGIVVFVQGNTKYVNSQYVYTLEELSRLFETRNEPQTLYAGHLKEAYRILERYINEHPVSKEEHISNMRRKYQS